jgi:lactate dehydrogenase-like 2-hydroxyacid dehydrogenase
MVRVLMRFDLPLHLRARLAAVHDLVTEPDSGVETILTVGTVGADAALMDRMPKLSLIACLGSGYENVDLAAARARGIKLVNGQGSNTECVADMAWGLLLATVRRIVDGDVYLRAGAWKAKPQARPAMVPSVNGARLGILGLGDIGMAIAARGAGFRMKTAYCNRRPRDVPYEYVASPEALADWADFLIVALRAGPDNVHIVNERVLRALGPTGVVINIARGSAVDESALIRGLNEGWLGGAGLDVFETEPHARADLIAAPRTVLTPHLGGATKRAYEDAVDLVLQNIAAHVAGRPLLTPIL